MPKLSLFFGGFNSRRCLRSFRVESFEIWSFEVNVDEIMALVIDALRQLRAPGQLTMKWWCQQPWYLWTPWSLAVTDKSPEVAWAIFLESAPFASPTCWWTVQSYICKMVDGAAWQIATSSRNRNPPLMTPEHRWWRYGTGPEEKPCFFSIPFWDSNIGPGLLSQLLSDEILGWELQLQGDGCDGEVKG